MSQPLRYDTVSFLSDYGSTDEFVGIVKSVIRSICPEAAVIDITHDVAPHDVRSGSLTLARSAQYLCAGVVLAVVDPGVGTARRAVAVEVGNGQSVLLGPDNGLLASAVAMVGGATRGVELTNPDYHLPAPGPTFAGRDIFAPVAAHLCLGVELSEFGPALDLNSLRPSLLPLSRLEEAELHAEVLWVDRFGNAQLNLGPEEIDHFGERVELLLGGSIRTAQRVVAYSDLRIGQIGLVVDSYGLVSLAADRASVAEELQLSPGDAVILRAVADDDASTGASVAVSLNPTRRAP